MRLFTFLSLAAVASGVITSDSCTRIAVQKCMYINRPHKRCGENETPTLKSNCCLTCKPAQCEIPPVCADGVEPSKDANGCITCKKPLVCTISKLKDCAASSDTLATCEEGVKPEINKDTCCATCKPAKAACTLDKAKRTACEEDLKDGSIPDCADGVEPVFNVSTCCRNCKKIILRKTKTCTRESVKDAYKQVEECEEGERPQKVLESCTLSCKRPEAACGVREVAKCLKNRPECGDDEDPARVEGACCKSCAKPRPKCDPACEGKFICFKGKCRKPIKIAIRLKAKKAAKEKFGEATKEELKDIIKEMIQRFCSNPDHGGLCRQDIVDDTINSVDVETNDEGEVEVSLAADDEAAPSRRLLSTGKEKQDLIVASLNSEAEDAGFDVETGPSNGAARLALPTLAVLVATLLALF